MKTNTAFMILGSSLLAGGFIYDTYLKKNDPANINGITMASAIYGAGGGLIFITVLVAFNPNALQKPLFAKKG